MTSLCNCKTDSYAAVRSAIVELEKAGWIKRAVRQKDERGKFATVTYTILISRKGENRASVKAIRKGDFRRAGFGDSEIRPTEIPLYNKNEKPIRNNQEKKKIRRKEVSQKRKNATPAEWLDEDGEPLFWDLP